MLTNGLPCLRALQLGARAFLMEAHRILAIQAAGLFFRQRLATQRKVDGYVSFVEGPSLAMLMNLLPIIFITAVERPFYARPNELLAQTAQGALCHPGALADALLAQQGR